VAQLLELINTDSTNALKHWCFSEALRTLDRGALRLWLGEWEKSDARKAKLNDKTTGETK
jgi:hypothetical protein